MASKKTTTEFIAGHPNWCHRVQEWQVAPHLDVYKRQEQYLPAYAREVLMEENERLRKELDATRSELREMQHYAAGLEYACLLYTSRCV